MSTYSILNLFILSIYTLCSALFLAGFFFEQNPKHLLFAVLLGLMATNVAVWL